MSLPEAAIFFLVRMLYFTGGAGLFCFVMLLPDRHGRRPSWAEILNLPAEQILLASLLIGIFFASAGPMFYKRYTRRRRGT